MGYNTPGMEAINALGWETLETRRAKSKVKQIVQTSKWFGSELARCSFRTQKKHNRI